MKFRPKLSKVSRAEAKLMDFDIGEIDEFEIHKFSVPGSDLYFERSGDSRTWGAPGCICVLFLGTVSKYRHQGRARALLETLHAYADKYGSRIEWGCYTEDGEKYLRHITNNVLQSD
jgi:hypothetical protein